MNALLSAIDNKLAQIHELLSLDAEHDNYPLVIGSVKATLTAGQSVIGDCWNVRELHGENNRYKHSRIYKKGKLTRHTNKYDLADSINYASAGYEPDVIEDFYYESDQAFVAANLPCGCEVTILESGTEYVTRCTSVKCHRRVLPY